MGKVIVKKIRGMRWWAKGALVLTVTLLCSVFMQRGWFTPVISDSATNTYRFSVDTVSQNVGVDGSTSTVALGTSNPTNPASLYTLTVSSASTGTGYLAIPGSATTTMASFYGPVYSSGQSLSAPSMRLYVRAGSGTTGQGTTFTATVMDYDPTGATGSTVMFTGTGTYTSTSTGTLTLGFGTAPTYTITPGHRVKITVTATNASSSAGRFYFYNSSTNSDPYFTVTENYPTNSTYVTNLADYNGGNITGVNQGQQNIPMLSFQLSTNSGASTTWSGGLLDQIGNDTNLNDMTFAIYKDANNDGVFDPAVDTKISNDTSFVNGIGDPYTLVTPQTITSTAQRFFVVFSLTPGATTGTTIGARIANSSYFTVGANNMDSLAAAASSTISVLASSAAVTKTYQVDFSSGATYSTPLPASGATTTTTACTTSASTYSTPVYGLLNYPSHTCTAQLGTNYNTLTTSGSITLYLNASGYSSAMNTVQAGSFTFYGATATSGTATTLTATLFYITPSGTKVTFPVPGTLNLGTSTTLASKTITFDQVNSNVSSVPKGSRLGMTLTTSGASARLGLNSTAGAKLVMSETASSNPGVDVGDGTVIPDGTVTAGRTGVLVDSFTMIAGSSQTVQSVTITGANANATNVSRVTVYRDNAPYGTLGSEDTVVGTGTFTGSSATVNMQNEPVGTGLNRYLVVYDIAPGAVVGQKIGGTVTAIAASQFDNVGDTSSAGLTVVASTVVMEGAGEPGNVNLGPGGAATNLDAFGLYTNGPADVIKTVTVDLSTGTSGAIALLEIVDCNSGTVYGSSTAPISGDRWRPTVSGLSATSGTTQCYVRITPKASVTGTFYTTGIVSAITNTQTGNAMFMNDALSATVTIDGIAPPDPTLTAQTGSSPGQVNLTWNAVTDSNVNNTGVTYKLVRGPANSPAPADCSGAAVYDGPLTSQVDTAVDMSNGVDGHSYTFNYRICSRDAVGNLSAGSLAGAASKLPSICGQTPTVAFIDSPSEYTKTGGYADVRLNIINNDIGDCPDVNFTVATTGDYNLSSFVAPTVTPATLTVKSNGAGANVTIRVKSLDSASQGDIQTVSVGVTAPGYPATSSPNLSTMVNNFGPMLHSSFSVGTKYGNWGQRSTCNDCHINSNETTKNIKLISQNVLTPMGRRPVAFNLQSSTVATSGVFGNERRPDGTSSTNICEVCHHNTKFHHYSAVTQQTTLDHHNGADCMQCHPHKGGFKYAGGAADCTSCHGNPPTSKVDMVSPPFNALGNNPTDYGAHATHNNLGMTCTVCHNNYTRNPMGNGLVEMGFAVRTSTFRGFQGNVNSGAITVSSNYNKLYGWASTSLGTTVTESVNQSVPSCSVYCHGGWGGGTNPNPTWVGTGQAACGTCHNVTNATPPTSGSHLKHASSGEFQENGTTVGGLGLTCDKCHGAMANYSSARHINGSVSWDLSAISNGALYRGQVSGATGNLAPSATFGSCSNLYCHSNVQGTNGVGGPTATYAPTWGGTASCGTCHVDMYTSPAATGGHIQHAQPSPNFATPFDCRICHGNGGTTNPLNHANGTINMQFGGYAINTVYSLGNNVAPGSGYGSCSNADCHGRRTITWGPSSALPLCDKCHGSKTSANGFYSTSGPGTSISNTDPQVGAHSAHIHQVNAGFDIYTSYSMAKDCSECHIKPSGPYDAGHIDTALPAEVTFQPGAIANRAVFYGISGAQAASYDYASRSCSNVWCHGAGMDSNLGRGAYANVVADGGTLGTPTKPTWNSPMLNGTPSNDCTRCHSYPPPAPNETYTHFSHYTTVGGVDIALRKSPNECYNCHVNIKTDGSGFYDGTLHINGVVDKGCNACHGVPPSSQATLAIQSNGALAPGQAGAHVPHANIPAIGKTCTVCHNGYPKTMPNYTLDMGFNAMNGQVTTGTFWGYSTVNNGLTTFVSSAVGTTVYQTNTQTDQNTCAVYCHGLTPSGAQLIGGRYGATTKPVWDSGVSMVCGNCHGVNVASSPAYVTYTAAMHVRPASAPTSSSHPKHAAPTALNYTCDTCHGVITNFDHVNGSVAWKLDTTNPKVGPNAVYGPSGNQTVSGATGTIAPSASYGQCSNIYCHSSGQSADGTSSVPTYANQIWNAGALACNSCHQDMNASGTGSHLAHTQSGRGNFSCVQCHGAGYTTTPGSITATTHVDMTINVPSVGYSKGSSFAPGTGYGTCSNTVCHGSGTPAWGGNLGSVQCEKCHADLNSATFYATSGNTSTSDAHAGAHQGHLKAGYGYTVPLTCDTCHPTTAIRTSTHMDGTVEFNTANISSYNPATGSCTTWCHGNGFDAAHVGSNISPVWNAGATYLTGTPSAAECGTCHAFPPRNATHSTVPTDTFANTMAACNACHPEVSTTGVFTNPSLHINGASDAQSSGGLDCSLCHNSSQTPLTSGMTTDTTTYHHVLGSSTPDYSGNTCLKCHADHDVSNPTASLNPANTLGVAANLRVANSIVPHKGDTPYDAVTNQSGTYVNTDFLPGTGGSDNGQYGGICISCHNNAQTKNLTNQKYASPFINTTTMVVTQAQFTGSMHNYSTTSTFNTGSSKFVANCTKCHSDSMSENRQIQPKTFGLHMSATRDLFGTLGAVTYNDAREDRLCFGCHSQAGDPIGGGGTAVKTVSGKDWYGSRTMRSTAYDTFQSFTTATRVFRHNVGKYNGLHKAGESETYLGADKHVECADCHNSHGAQYGNHTPGSGTMANVLTGVPGVTPTYSAAGSTTLGLPGVTGTTLWVNSTVPPAAAPTSQHTTATITTPTWTTIGMSNTAPSTTTPTTKTITVGATSSAYYGVDAIVSAPMTNGATLAAQTATLTVYASYATAGSAPRLYAYAYLWNGTAATALTTSTYVTLGTSAAACTYTITIPQTTISNANTVLVTELYAQSRSTTAGTATIAYNATGTSGATAGPTNITFTAAPVYVWNSASSFTPAPATAEYQVCFKCHSNANPNLSTWGGTAGTAAAWTDLSLEFNPNNKSGHPVLASLNNYPNSASPQALTAAKMVAPWNVNVGTQVMTCTDCHATDSAASKGPHGSSVKWMLAGVNKAWPYTSAANNGTSTGTFYAMSNKTTNQGTVNGLFCLNCHVVTSTNVFHSAVNNFTSHHGFTMNCVSCHIRVPHGGKISRLLNTVTNVPARYMNDGKGTNSAGASITKFTKGAATLGNSNFTCSGGEHSGGTEAW